MPTDTIDVSTADGTADALLARPAGGGPYPGVLFYMDAIGLRPQLERMAGRLADRGYVVLVPNLFYRHGRAPLVADLPDLLKPENRPKLMASLGGFMASLTPAAATRDAGTYLDCLAGQEQTAPGPVGVTGYCMGGALSLRTAAAYPDRVAAAASFHGGNLATETPDSPHRQAGRIRAEVYLGHADQDPSMPAEQIERLDAALAAAGVRHRTETYAGAKHGYTMADTASYDEAAAERHWAALFGLLSAALPTTA